MKQGMGTRREVTSEKRRRPGAQWLSEGEQGCAVFLLPTRKA
jgi:hypothetical protein